MIDLGTFGGPSSEAVAINDHGQVVGSADTKAIYKSGWKKGYPIAHAFLWENGKMRDLGTFGGPASTASDINEHGQVVGWADTKARDKNGDPIRHAFLWQNGKMRDLATLGGPESGATAINERGQVVGSADTQARVKDADPSVRGSSHAISHAFLWQNGKLRDLGVLPKRVESHAYAINERSQIVGSSCSLCDAGRDGYTVSRASLWQAGKLTALGCLRGRSLPWAEPNCAAVAINERGQGVGWSDQDGRPRPVLWRAGKAIDLGWNGHAVAINESGQVVGWSETDTAARAFLWHMGKKTPLPGLGGSREARAISNAGQIVGWSETKSGDTHAVLWTLKRG